MPLKQPEEIENYDLKAKTLRENGWEDYYHPDNWIRTEWKNTFYGADRRGCSTDAAYAGFVDNIIPIEVKNHEAQLIAYGNYLLRTSNDENLKVYIEETLPEFYIASEEHLYIIDSVLRKAQIRINGYMKENILTFDEYLKFW